MSQSVPDVRVRLSAEGVDEVLRAFNKVAAAGKKTGKEGGAGVSILNDALGKLRLLLPAITVGAAVAGIGALVKSALEGADAVGKLAQKTGISTEALSTLKFAAELADASFEGLSNGLVKFNKSMAELDGGSRDVGQAIRQLFGDSRALAGLNTEERFLKVADALGKMDAGYQKTRLSQVFFGKSGADLIPLLDDLANGGFERARVQAEKFGLVIDQKTATAAQRANDAVKLLALQVKGASTLFTSGFAPGFSDTLEKVADLASTENRNGFVELGEKGAGAFSKITESALVFWETLKFLSGEVFRFGGSFDDVAIAVDQKFTVLRRAAGEKLFGDPKKFLNADEIFNLSRLDSASARFEAFQERIEAIRKKFNEPAKPNAGKPKGGTPDIVTPDAAAEKASLDLVRARLDAELALNKAFAAQAEQINQATFDEGLKSLKEYYDERERIARAGDATEIASLEAKRKVAVGITTNSASEEIAKAKDIEAIDDEIARKKVDQETAAAQRAAARRAADRDLGQRRLDVERQILDAQGRTFEAAIAAIQRQAVELKKQGIGDSQIRQLTELATRQATFNEAQRRSALGLGEISAIEAELQGRVASGELFPFEAANKYRDAAVGLIPRLRELATEFRAAASTPEEIQTAQAFSQRIDQIAVSANKSGQAMAQFKAQIEGGFTAAFQTFLTSGLEESTNALDALRRLALGLAQAMQQAAAQIIATAAAQKLLSFFGGGTKSAGNEVATAAAKGAAQATPLVVAASVLTAASVAITASGGIMTAAALTWSITAAEIFAAANALAIANAAGSFAGFASGGFVSGPGTGTSDSIPARLSHGEFVVRAAAVRQPGALALLASLNGGLRTPTVRSSMAVSRFADGGLVQGSAGAAGGISRDHILVEASDDLIVRQIESGPGSRAVIRALTSNRTAVRRALGLDR